jgi:1,4-dihydroxy-2-naphthoate octaprenyltransferase
MYTLGNPLWKGVHRSMAGTGDAPLSGWQVWMLAARPKTLPAAAAPVIVGSALAFVDGAFHWGPALAALLAALLLQVGANFANDLFDYQRGADAGERLGPVRVTQSGLLTPGQVRLGMGLVFGVAALLGLYLALVAGWPVVLMGLASIAAALAYTGGPFPFGYYGLGDLFVFLFFGVVAVCGTYYVQAHAFNALALWSSLPMGFLITAILVVNNLRDIDNDRRAAKRTLAVRLGPQGTRLEYLFCLLGAYLTPGLLWLSGMLSPWIMLTWLSLPLAYGLLRFIWRQQGRPLNRALAGTGRLTLIYAVLYALGLILPVL